MYADDTTLYSNLANFSSSFLESEITENLTILNDRLRMNKLSLNVDKTRLIIYRKAK